MRRSGTGLRFAFWNSTGAGARKRDTVLAALSMLVGMVYDQTLTAVKWPVGTVHSSKAIDSLYANCQLSDGEKKQEYYC